MLAWWAHDRLLPARRPSDTTNGRSHLKHAQRWRFELMAGTRVWSDFVFEMHARRGVI